jgi:tRNA dimethylallyltransferase
MTRLKNSTLPYLALTGPTAAGKTAATFAIAKTLPVEIISVDSALVYTGMDIGTAKPTIEELASVPHHLINIRDPLQPYSAAEFVADANTLMAQIHARGKTPLLVGGTMLYFKALFEGLDDMPKANPEVRAEIASQALEKGWPAMHAQLALIDPISAARLQPQDSQRISRALEVWTVSGQPLSSFHSQSAEKDSAAKAGAARLISLEPDDRSWLHLRIAQRFEAMLAQDFMAEVKALRARGDLHIDLPSMRCVGYRQAWAALDQLGTDRPMTNAEWNDFKDKGIVATRQLAKRQITWLRSMPERQIIACDKPDALQRVIDLTAKAMQQQT